ncbi:MAG: manganese efflux pump MntP family protein [Actinomycetota bacterium]|nr:manganese efflux pump MntP family protein [Actinomycetota bacterium]
MIKLIALILPLGLDTFAISAALGLTHAGRRQRWKISALFAAFEGGMPLIGLALGAPLGRAVGDAAEYAAIGILVALGVFMIAHADGDDDLDLADTAWPAAILLGLSVSLDELAIGFTLGLLAVPVIPAVVLVAVQAAVVAQLGLRLGSRLSATTRERADRAAGVALVTIGFGLLVSRAAA